MAELYKNNLSTEQKCWLAGFIDGEGYLGIIFQRKKETKSQAASPRYHPYLVIANTDLSVLSYIEEMIDAGKVYALKKATERTKKSFQYKLTRMEILQNVLESIEPHLKIKFSQCHILIEFIKRRRRTTFVTGRGSRGRTSFTDADEDSYRSLLKLNKRGP